MTQVLPRLMRGNSASELMVTARMLDAETAGFITRIAASLLQATQNLAVEILRQSPEAVNGSKVLINKTWSLPPGEGLTIEADMQANLMVSPNQIEAVMAGLTTRLPKFV